MSPGNFDKPPIPTFRPKQPGQGSSTPQSVKKSAGSGSAPQGGDEGRRGKDAPLTSGPRSSGGKY